jgi:quercetin dioxygenase-like cupin family protein
LAKARTSFAGKAKSVWPLSTSFIFGAFSMLILKQAAFTLMMSAGILTGVAHAEPPQAIVKQVMTKPLGDYPGKEALMITVDYPPGAVDPVHRHRAHSLVYVLEGSIVMQVQGGQEVTLTPGQSYYEGPDDLHTVGRNASLTRPAKFLVVLLKDQNVPFFIPEPQAHPGKM